MGKSWRVGLILGLAFALAISGTFLFAYRAGRQARRIHRADEPIREWMSIPFIAHTHHVPAAPLFAAIGVQPREPFDRRSLRRIARETRRPLPELIAQLQRAIDANSGPARPPAGRQP